MTSETPSPENAARLEGRRIIVGLTGGIACYKVASAVSALAQGGAQVTVAMTEAAQRFVSALTFQALRGRPVYPRQWQPRSTSTGSRSCSPRR